MSYGHANRRDERRKSAIPRIEAAVERAEKALADAKAELKKAQKGTESAAQKELKYCEGRVDRIREHLRGTQANMGKGTRAMQKNG